MVHIQIPSVKKCYNPVLQSLHALGGSAINKSIYDWVANKLELTDQQLAVLRKPENPSLGTKIGHHIDFAKSHLKTVGLLTNPTRRVWALSDAGKNTLEVDPDEIQREVTRIGKEKKGQKQRQSKVNSPEEISPNPQSPPNDIHLRNLIRLPSEHELDDLSEISFGYQMSHDEIQWLLLSLGDDMGLDVWVASNDRNRSFDGNSFSEVPRLRNSLPVQFDQRTQRIIELIDVLWLQGNSILAAFEIEHTTAIYSGLLRMSDLIALQPNLNISLYIVAPDERRDKVKTETNRPTFGKLRLPQRCRYIAYTRLTQKIEEARRGGFLSYLSPSFLNEISEDMNN